MTGYVEIIIGNDTLRSKLRRFDERELIANVVFERNTGSAMEYFVLVGAPQKRKLLPSIKRYHSTSVNTFRNKIGTGASFDTGYYKVQVCTFRSFEENAYAVMMILDALSLHHG